jgi:hypothetical protein
MIATNNFMKGYKRRIIMACNCIEHLEAELRESTGDDEAFIRTNFDVKDKIRRPPIEGYYRGKILGKLFKKNLSIAFLSSDYCPFCGKKYVDGSDVRFCRIKMKRDKRTRERDFYKGREYPAFVNKHGRIYLQDICGERIFLKAGDYTVLEVLGAHNESDS